MLRARTSALLQHERIAAIHRIAARAKEAGAQFVVVAGDLFDAPTPTKPGVSAACSAIGAIDLPVVFDDAFVYFDPDRVQKLQRILDLTASRGLHVIVLTRNSWDYAALGARQITLSGQSELPAPPLPELAAGAQSLAAG